jgi:hypothetical protein
MRRPTTFFKRLGSMMLAGYGIAASAAHADPSSSAAVSASATVSASPTQSEAQRLCAASSDAKSKDAGALARFETGTTFMLTENGLIVLKRPAPKKWYSAVKSDEPENLNTGG